jgi:hypothetical protein
MESYSHGKGQRFRAKLVRQTVKSFSQLVNHLICEFGHGDGVIQPRLKASSYCNVAISDSLDLEDALPLRDFVKGSV